MMTCKYKTPGRPSDKGLRGGREEEKERRSVGEEDELPSVHLVHICLSVSCERHETNPRQMETFRNKRKERQMKADGYRWRFFQVIVQGTENVTFSCAFRLDFPKLL